MSQNESTNGTLASNRNAMDRFLDKLREGANVQQACMAAGVPRRTVYNWRDKWATFRQEWEDALEDACDGLEDVAWQRALRDRSDRMIMFLLKAHRPQKYMSRWAGELSGPGGGPIPIREIVVALPDDDGDDDDASGE